MVLLLAMAPVEIVKDIVIYRWKDPIPSDFSPVAQEIFCKSESRYDADDSLRRALDLILKLIATKRERLVEQLAHPGGATDMLRETVQFTEWWECVRR